jgi:hypothetical protein
MILVILAGAIVYELTFSPWSIPEPEGAWIEYAIRQAAWLYAFVLCGLALTVAYRADHNPRFPRILVGGVAGIMTFLTYYAFATT